MGKSVVHDAAGPRHLSLELQPSFQQETAVAHFPFGRERDLVFAVLILGVGRVLINARIGQARTPDRAVLRDGGLSSSS